MSGLFQRTSVHTVGAGAVVGQRIVDVDGGAVEQRLEIADTVQVKALDSGVADQDRVCEIGVRYRRGFRDRFFIIIVDRHLVDNDFPGRKRTDVGGPAPDKNPDHIGEEGHEENESDDQNADEQQDPSGPLFLLGLALLAGRAAFADLLLLFHLFRLFPGRSPGIGCLVFRVMDGCFLRLICRTGIRFCRIGNSGRKFFRFLRFGDLRLRGRRFGQVDLSGLLLLGVKGESSHFFIVFHAPMIEDYFLKINKRITGQERLSGVSGWKIGREKSRSALA